MYRVIYQSDKLHKETTGYDTLMNDTILENKKVEELPYSVIIMDSEKNPDVRFPRKNNIDYEKFYYDEYEIKRIKVLKEVIW